jgi:hypothetical protein
VNYRTALTAATKAHIAMHKKIAEIYEGFIIYFILFKFFDFCVVIAES